MRNIIAAVLFGGLILVLSGCYSAPDFGPFYKAWHEESFFPKQSYLGDGETPLIIKTLDLENKRREMLSNWYWCIGYSGFNGIDYSDYEINDALTKLSREKRAKVAIWAKDYTDTKNGVYSVPHTHYNSYVNASGYVQTTATTSYSTYSYSVERYDYTSYLFVPIPEESKKIYAPGFSVADLTQRDRDLYKQNVGCLIYTVFKNSVAYYANLSYGDIITQINEQPIYSMDDYIKFKRKARSGDNWRITIVRNGMEKEVKLIFGLYKE